MTYPDLGSWGEMKPVDAEADAIAVAEAIAWTAIDNLTGGQIAFDPTTVRPMVVATDGSVRLPPPVGDIVQVRADGAVFTTWRLLNSNAILPTGGSTFSAGQDLTGPDDAVGTIEVDYYQGWRPGPLLIWAAQQLALEFYRAAVGDKKCRLPKNVTSVVRQGVSFTIEKPPFTDGRTGIQEIDIILARYNPYGLTSRTVVKSPETIAATSRLV